MFELFTDATQSIIRPGKWLYTTWFRFLVRYRQTFLGPLWIIASPILFIGFLGALFVGLSNFSTSEFIPHMTIGFIVWTILGGFLSRSSSLYMRNKPLLIQGETRQTDIVMLDIAELVVHFLHQSALIVAVCIFYKTITGPYALISLLGLLVVIINGFWFTIVMGILGARFRDLEQVMSSLSSIAFLATPIIWMPTTAPGDIIKSRASILEVYMNCNPMYHFVELIRAPLMGQTIAPLTIVVVLCSTIIGYALAAFLYFRYKDVVVLWT